MDREILPRLVQIFSLFAKWYKLLYGHINAKRTGPYVVVITPWRGHCRKYFSSLSYFATYFTNLLASILIAANE